MQFLKHQMQEPWSSDYGGDSCFIGRGFDSKYFILDGDYLL